MKVNFKCPKCGCRKIEEVMHGVIQYSTLFEIDEDLETTDYGHTSTEGGEVAFYACMECGEQLISQHGETVTDVARLIEWLKAHKSAKRGKK